MALHLADSIGKLFFFNLLNLCVCYLQVCMCTVGVPGVIGGQKWALDPLELELWAFVSPVDVGNGTRGPCKSNE